MLDNWDNGHYGSRERQSARNMFMSTTSTMRDAANNVGDAMASQSARVFGAGFSFRQSHTFGNQKESTNLHSVWNDDQEDTGSIQGTRVHKTWQEVMLNKKRRRRVCLSLICLVLAIVLISVSLSSTSEQRAAKRAANFPGSGAGVPVTFYATSNIPYNQDQEKQFINDLSTIPNDAEFVAHLGNIQDASVSMCPESRPYEVASMLKRSPVPVFLVPGAEDWIECPRQNFALNTWLDVFGEFDRKFNSPLAVKRSKGNPELFVILHNGVLFFGLHLVSGTLQDPDGQMSREQDMKNFFFGMLNFYKEQFRAVVMLGNARPGPQQKAFFDTIGDSLNRARAPVAYIHADSGVGSVQYTPIPELPNVVGIQVPSGSVQKPLKITVGFGAHPFVVG
jgi:hypothetical protein